MSLSPPVDKKAKSSVRKQIGDLTDADLAAIFERLPPYDRLIAADVCLRWRELGQMAWLDVAELDLSPIPGKDICAIVLQCPKLRSVFAFRKSFDLNELVVLSKSSSLTIVKLYHCTFAVASGLNTSVVNDGFAKIFSEDLQHTSWKELVLHDAVIVDKSVNSNSCAMPPIGSTTWIAHRQATCACPKWAFSAAYLPASLTRLQLSGVCFKKDAAQREDLFLDGLHRLENLVSCILHEPEMVDYLEPGIPFYRPMRYGKILHKLCALKNLKELYVCLEHFGVNMRFISHLPKLEVLVFNDLDPEYNADDLKELVRTNSVLRVLVLTGAAWPFALGQVVVEIPARKRFPHGFGSDALPLLHIFVHKELSEVIRFAKSSSDAAIVYQIDERMEKFLEREDIAPIFEGSWVVRNVKGWL